MSVRSFNTLAVPKCNCGTPIKIDPKTPEIWAFKTKIPTIVRSVCVKNLVNGCAFLEQLNYTYKNRLKPSQLPHLWADFDNFGCNGMGTFTATF